MKYVLEDNYALRGFLNGRQKVLMRLDNRRKIPLSELMTMVLLMCDGEKDFDDYSAIPFYDYLVKKALENGWIKKAEHGQKLTSEQRYTETRQRNIDSVQWSITGHCNAKCRHCYITSSQHQHNDLSTDEMIVILDKLAEREISELNITGGEPLVRPDFPIILKEMVKRKICLNAICTNGFLLSERILDMFEEYGMKPGIQISFDGVGCHDWLRGIKGSELMTVNAMEQCRKKNIPFTLNMCIHNGNIHSIPDTVKLAVLKGAKGIRISPVIKTIDGYQEEHGVRVLTINDLAPVYLSYLPDLVKERPHINIEFNGFLEIKGNEPEKYRIIPCSHPCTNFEDYHFCNHVEHSFYISDEGRVLPCMNTGGTILEQKCLKLTEHSIDECLEAQAYEEFINLSAENLIKHNSECAKCEFFKYCGCGCRALAMEMNGSMYEKESFRCEFFKNRWHEKIKTVMDQCLR